MAAAPDDVCSSMLPAGVTNAAARFRKWFDFHGLPCSASGPWNCTHRA